VVVSTGPFRGAHPNRHLRAKDSDSNLPGSLDAPGKTGVCDTGIVQIEVAPACGPETPSQKMAAAQTPQPLDGVARVTVVRLFEERSVSGHHGKVSLLIAEA
jgi:hypothetical protein